MNGYTGRCRRCNEALPDGCYDCGDHSVQLDDIKIGETYWFVHECAAHASPASEVDRKRSLVGVVDGDEPSLVAWFDIGNVFPARFAAIKAAKRWQRESRERAVASDRADIRDLCLDEASREGQRAKQATKKGRVDDAVIARCKADAFRKIARLLAPKKASRVTK